MHPAGPQDWTQARRAACCAGGLLQLPADGDPGRQQQWLRWQGSPQLCDAEGLLQIMGSGLAKGSY